MHTEVVQLRCTCRRTLIANIVVPVLIETGSGADPPYALLSSAYVYCQSYIHVGLKMNKNEYVENVVFVRSISTLGVVVPLFLLYVFALLLFLFFGSGGLVAVGSSSDR